jgi:hypothetical protein
VWNGLVVLDGTCAVHCGSGTYWLCWMVTVLWAVRLERIGFWTKPVLYIVGLERIGCVGW